MARKKFTKEEMEALKTSSYVLDITPSVVHFSAEFKEKFWDLLKSGKAPKDAIIELDIDPDILGVNRIDGLRTMIRNELRAGNGFRDIRACMTNPEVRVAYLEQQLAYKDQEIEFLKKIVSLGKEAAEL